MAGIIKAHRIAVDAWMPSAMTACVLIRSAMEPPASKAAVSMPSASLLPSA